MFGTRSASEGAEDTEWLAKIAHTGWVVLNRDAKIMERPHELAAYRAAKVHMFYLPGQATRDELTRLVKNNLSAIITHATSRKPDVWRIAERGIEPFTHRAPRNR